MYLKNLNDYEGNKKKISDKNRYVLKILEIEKFLALSDFVFAYVYKKRKFKLDVLYSFK